MSRISTSDFKKGIYIEFRGEPHQIVDNTFVNPGKGSAFVRTKLKNLKTKRVCEFTYKSGEVVEEIPVEVSEMQYLYLQDDLLFFMDPRSYEQVSLPKDLIGDFINLIKEGEIFQILLHDGKALDMRIPPKVRLKVTESLDESAGNTVNGAKKYVTVETGAKVLAPLFVKTGEIIIIDPVTFEYTGRETGGKY